MKKSMRISALIMAALTLVLLFAGCGRRTLQTRLEETMYSRAIPLRPNGRDKRAEPERRPVKPQSRHSLGGTTGDVNRDIIAGAQEYFEELGASVTVTDGQGDLKAQ